MNEFANIAERLGVDIENVRQGIGSDPRIGSHFIYAGCGYGGSCFPKDVSALRKTARSVDVSAEILDATENVNRRQKSKLFEMFERHFGGKVKELTVGLWGLAFKPGTDDMREASSRVLIERMRDAGVTVKAYDPQAMQEARRIFGDDSNLILCADAAAATVDVDALFIVTEWMEFRSPDLDQLRQNLRNPLIFDGRNLYDPAYMRNNGFTYYSIGRPLPTGARLITAK